jgi:hypothetical protein
MRVACSAAIDWRLHDISEFVASVRDNNHFHMFFAPYCEIDYAVEVLEG